MSLFLCHLTRRCVMNPCFVSSSSFIGFPTAILVQFLTERFIGEYASNTNSLHRKILYIDGKQLYLCEVFDPCYQGTEAKCILEGPVNWADGFVVVYNISDPVSFTDAENILQQTRETRMENFCLVGNKQDLCHARQVCEEEGRSLAQENCCPFQEVSAAESYQEIASLFTRLIRDSMAKFIKNVFGKRRKSV
uniref:small monomeric GTPase n=1 Tax=Esox lucius TaxID=8010 RepID=A0A3P8XE25_ESOLU